MKKLFISQPMKDKTETEILLERKEAIDDAQFQLGESVKPIDSFLKNAPKNVERTLWMLGKSIELLAQADVVYFCDGWEYARGCKIEHDAAVAYGLDVIYE